MQWNELLSERHFYAKPEEGILYENDYDTIICSTLFRRLQDKAQVFPLDDDDYVRTRLTHSLEVSAKSLAHFKRTGKKNRYGIKQKYIWVSCRKSIKRSYQLMRKNPN